jgi:Alw26I/Eco31I/Esp3I family type II restriction m6 adenine DNA methyltransferase
MKHVKMLKERATAEDLQQSSSKDLLIRATGKFYTHLLIGEHLVKSIVPLLAAIHSNTLSIVEPFCGDGRLICILLKAVSKSPKLKKKQFLIELWELDSEALNTAKEKVMTLAKNLKLKVKLNAMNWDTFVMGPSHFGKYHLCITNPPWDVLKPDNRELQHLLNGKKDDYINELKLQESALTIAFPLSAPKKKFSGWGINLSRCGVELCFRLIADDGFCGVVSPSSLLADQMSVNLRNWLFEKYAVLDVAFYAAEGRLFANVDQPCITIVAAKSSNNDKAPSITLYDRVHNGTQHILNGKNWEILKKRGYIFPVQFGLNLIGIHNKLTGLPTFKSLETDCGFWAGREIDETGHRRFLNLKGQHLFLKGKMVKRFGLAEQPKEYLTHNGPKIPSSVQFNRIVWRDVARPNQKRRIHATIIPSSWVCGNSLHVAYFKDGNLPKLHALLGIINSLVFESQVRANLSTAHISLGIVRLAHLPNLEDNKLVNSLSETVSACLGGCEDSKVKLEVQVAKAFSLSREDFAEVLSAFTKLEQSEIDKMLGHEEWNVGKLIIKKGRQNIPNHYSGNLSNLDKLIVNAVPPGGNWKNIPESVPSQRLKQIREGYAAGEGSRSTYYGRLSPNAPSYTINTYFSRPGNGCHIRPEEFLSSVRAGEVSSQVFKQCPDVTVTAVQPPKNHQLHTQNGSDQSCCTTSE